MNKIHRHSIPTRKEKNIFFTGLVIGLAGSLIGNFVVSGFYDLMNEYHAPLCGRWLIFILALVAFFGLIVWFAKILNSLIHLIMNKEQ